MDEKDQDHALVTDVNEDSDETLYSLSRPTDEPGCGCHCSCGDPYHISRTY